MYRMLIIPIYGILVFTVNILKKNRFEIASNDLYCLITLYETFQLSRNRHTSFIFCEFVVACIYNWVIHKLNTFFYPQRPQTRLRHYTPISRKINLNTAIVYASHVMHVIYFKGTSCDIEYLNIVQSLQR